MKRTGREFIDGTVKCPFCEFSTDIDSTNPACGGCYVEFYRIRQGAIVFDTERHTEQAAAYARARLFAGMRLGAVKETD